MLYASSYSRLATAWWVMVRYKYRPGDSSVLPMSTISSMDLGDTRTVAEAELDGQLELRHTDQLRKSLDDVPQFVITCACRL